ncbi:MAG TPA: tRNA (adenosine(37)-N6)-dimethylallyltransferase MiaA [Candidatus Acidoferrum sp.]|nr:tRNA (adenosine(37)-N6)-dimethylallyltransferase MiaA [Candidatus Acidoferrum sp.]
MNTLPRLIVVLGPTASGKSALGIEIARRIGGEILVCDSTQVYRYFDIGTAKVPAGAQKGIPHHLVNLVEPTELFTAGDFRRCALEALGDLRSRGKVPVLTAGTGLYLRALLEGLSEAPVRSEELRERLRCRARLHGPEYLHRLLARLDAAAAHRIAPRDAQKVIRAIEIRVLAKKSVGEVHGAGRLPLEGYEILKLGLNPPREALYARIHARIDSMLAEGWLEEVRRLIDAGIPHEAKPFQFIGYSELRAHLQGTMPLAEAIQKIRLATRNFAKRQLTWFRREPRVHWLSGFGDAPVTLDQAFALISSPLLSD